MEKCYRDLADAIILRAVKDYRKALKNKRWGSVRMIERFLGQNCLTV